jgi:hypothetical protein
VQLKLKIKLSVWPVSEEAEASGACSEKRDDRLVQYFGRKKLKEGDNFEDLDVKEKIT